MLLTAQRVPTHPPSILYNRRHLILPQHRLSAVDSGRHITGQSKRAVAHEYFHHVPSGHHRAFHCLWQCLQLVGSGGRTPCAVSEGFFFFFFLWVDKVLDFGEELQDEVPPISS